MATCQPRLEAVPLQQMFLLAQMPELHQQNAKEGHFLQLQVFSLNPIFAHRAEQMLLDLLKVSKAEAIVYLLSADQQPPDVLKTFRWALK